MSNTFIPDNRSDILQAVRNRTLSFLSAAKMLRQLRAVEDLKRATCQENTTALSR